VIDKTTSDKRKVKEVLTVIHGFIDEHGFSPSMRELAPMFGVRSLSAVKHWLSKLKRLGYISYSTYQARTVRLTKEGYKVIGKTP
jgi:repressor LexA